MQLNTKLHLLWNRFWFVEHRVGDEQGIGKETMYELYAVRRQFQRNLPCDGHRYFQISRGWNGMSNEEMSMDATDETEL